MSPRLPVYALLLLAPIAFALPLHAQESKNSEAVMMSSEGFLDAHPDIKHRQAGLRHWEAGEYGEAFEQFKRAARFADKPSQGMIAEMLWRGEGVAQDRPAAYAWMDLAAERHYRPMLIQREVYWDALSEAEREKAMDIGKDLYAEYGDVVAKPRVERKMRFARRAGTGGRVGPAGRHLVRRGARRGRVGRGRAGSGNRPCCASVRRNPPAATTSCRRAGSAARPSAASTRR